MRVPFGSLVLVLAVLLPYFLLSGGLFYLSDEAVATASFGAAQPEGILSHAFLHVGFFHLIGNLVPLAIFALLLETALVATDVVILFVVSAVLASGLFSLVNPGAFLIGSSAGVSGLMTAATILRPRKALPLLIATPLIIYLLAFPAANALSDWNTSRLAEEQSALSQEVRQLVAQNKTVEAAEANESLQAVAAQHEQTIEGVQREAVTPTDFIVHVIGALVAVVYLFAFRREKIFEGILEFESLREDARRFFSRIKQ